MAVRVPHTFERYHALAQTFLSGYDGVHANFCSACVAEKSGDLQQLIDAFQAHCRYLIALIRAQNRGQRGQNLAHLEVSMSLFDGLPSLLGEENAHMHPFVRDIRSIFELLELTNDTAVEWYNENPRCAILKKIRQSSSDGLHHRFHADMVLATIRSSIGLATESIHTLNMDWLSTLPAPEDSNTLHCCFFANIMHVTARVLIAEVSGYSTSTAVCFLMPSVDTFLLPLLLHAQVLESLGNHTEALAYAQAECSCDWNNNLPSRSRAGRVLARCHVALGQESLSIAAFDAAAALSKSAGFKLSETLSIRERVKQGKVGGATHWEVGRRQLDEVVKRMKGPPALMERLASPARPAAGGT